MNKHPILVAGGLFLALAACSPLAAEYTESESPKAIRLDNASARIGVRFAPGSSQLLPGDAVRLRRLAASGSIAPSDRVKVSAAGGPALAAARVNAIADELLRYGIITAPASYGGAPPNRAIIDTGRYLVTLPPCPNWSKPAVLGYTNTVDSNFGCATAVNFAQMVANPADLAEGRPVGPVDAIPAAAAVQRYEGDKIKLPAGANIGVITAPVAGTVSGGTGAGSAGSTP